ncbi:MAG: M20/M25/M40 family metallo-hydrolase [Bacillota bacterium]
MTESKLYNNLLELCRIPSISETPGELKIAAKIYQLLKEINYFHDHPELINLCPIPEDKYNRSFVYALMQGKIKNPKTVILLSHFDVVGVDDFGMAKELAFEPVLYTRHLKNNPQIELSEEARADLESGDYLFGRGTMDMKFGIAAYIEMLMKMEKELDSFPGNILFLSVPDEEANSAGMLAAVDLLLSLKKEKQLEYTCCLISEPFFPKYPGDRTKYIYNGTIGKLLPVFYCVGKETHVGEPFSGLNPNLLTGKIIEKIDSNPQLADSVKGHLTPAPVCLKQSDTKTAYSVQTPYSAYTYFNYMTLSKTPQEVMQLMVDIAQNAFKQVLADIKEKADAWSKSNQSVSDHSDIGNSFNLPLIKPMVITYQELYQWCFEKYGAKFESHIKDFIKNYWENASDGSGDLRDLSIEIVKEAHKFCPYREPMIVIFYAPPFYPHSDMQLPDSQVTKVSQYIQRLAKDVYQEDLEIESFFPGLSDMSYLGLSNRIDVTELTKNFPVWDAGYHIPLTTIQQLNIPFINIGPLGKDAHKFTERLCLSYSFDKAVPLIWAAIKNLLLF